LDAYLPEKVSREDSAWLAMPIATPLAQALVGESLEAVIAAVAAVADALARLKAEHGLAHRDIKPGNLYQLGGEALVGDFGLVAVPDVAGLTKTGQPIGPAHFTPYEMLVDPSSSDGSLADVYSLAKTLWVLATEQRFPPEGHQPSTQSGFTVQDMRPHPRAETLDRFIDRATQLRPEQRPTIEQAATDLRAWLELADEAQALDVSEIRARMREKIGAELNEQDLQAQRRELALEAVRYLQSLMAPVNAALRDLHPAAEIDAMADAFVQNMLSTVGAWQGEDVVFRWQRRSVVRSGRPDFPYELTVGRSIELMEGGDLVFKALVDAGYRSLGGRAFHWQGDARRAPVGSVEAERQIQLGVDELIERLQEGLAAYVEGIPESP
jgi:hypothetical protein